MYSQPTREICLCKQEVGAILTAVEPLVFAPNLSLAKMSTPCPGGTKTLVWLYPEDPKAKQRSQVFLLPDKIELSQDSVLRISKFKYKFFVGLVKIKLASMFSFFCESAKQLERLHSTFAKK